MKVVYWHCMVIVLSELISVRAGGPVKSEEDVREEVSFHLTNAVRRDNFNLLMLRGGFISILPKYVFSPFTVRP